MRPCLHPGCPSRVPGTYCEKHGQGQVVDRPSSAKRGYGAKWQAYTRAYLARPENRWCRCGCGARSQMVDHIRRVSGPDDPQFWDPGNHQALSLTCHARKTNRYDGGLGNPKRDVPQQALTGIVLLAGPPCAGKSTHAGSLGVAVLDWDELYARTSGLPLHVRGPREAQLRAEVERSFRAAVEGAHRSGRPTIIIRGAPERWQRGMYRRVFGAQVLVLEVPADECLRRLEASDRPAEEREATARAIRGWWARYERSPHDSVVRSQAEVAA